MIQVENLVKSFGPRIALAGVSFSVEAGEFVTLVGPNGAGKTTLLRILATLSRPTSGTLRIAGLDPTKAGDAARRRIGFLSHRTLLYDDLTAEQNLRFYAQMYDLDDGAARIDDLLKRVGLAVRRHDLVRTFSRGMQQRLSVARAVLHGLLTGLAGGGCTVLLTTHNLERGLAAGQRAMVLARGRLVYDERKEALDPTTFADTYRALTV
jgi:heme exporter protein A